jgi:mannose-1-phosphate guanylyltransferase
MAGGGGTRFWPRSRQGRPKQFLALGSERTLLQLAWDRIAPAISAERTWVITAERHCELVARQLPELLGDQIIGEPCGRDTAACIALGAGLIARQDPAAVMLVMPADHLIEPAGDFCQAVQVAAELALERADALVTFGIVPTFPATGYGYIQRGAPVLERDRISVYQVQSFREKPKADVAERFFSSGEYFWNSGIFVWKAATILAALHDRQPGLWAAVNRIVDAWPTTARNTVFKHEYEGLARISIDYAVMEQASNVLVVKAPFRWDDVGSWLALERMHPRDSDGNTVMALHEGIQTKNCVIVADPGHLVATAGVQDLLIIQDGNATLVAARSEEGNIKQLVESLKKNNLERYL